MSAYDDAVLADNPVAYWKLEELDPAPPIPNTALDDLANGLDGSLYPANSSTGLVQGITGPILTDPVSYGMQGAVGRYPPSTGANGTPLQIDNDQTWEVWFKHVSVPGPSGVEASVSTFLNRGGQTTGTYLSTGQRSSGLFADQLYWSLRFVVAGSSVASVVKSCQIPRDPDIWYHGAGVRRANEQWLYLNGWLVDYRDDCPTGPVSIGSNSAWKFGYMDNAIFGAVSRNQGMSHAALYDKALTQAQLRVHIVAALGELPDNPCGVTPEITVGCPGATGTVGEPYASEVTVTGGTPPYTYAIISGALPDGLHLDEATGAITGTPTVGGTFNFTVQVTDADLNTGTSPGCQIVVSEPAPPEPPGPTRTVTFDSEQPGLGNSWYLALLPSDSGDELRDTNIKPFSVTGKGSGRTAKWYAWGPTDDINVSDVEDGTNATAEVSVPDAPTTVERSPRLGLNVPNAMNWSMRLEGVWDGNGEKDRVDQIAIEQAKQGIRR